MAFTPYPADRLVTRLSRKDMDYASERVNLIHYLVEDADDIMMSDTQLADLLGELREYLYWIKCIHRKHAEYSDYVNDRAERFNLGIVEFALPCQLDRTSWEDLYDQEGWLQARRERNRTGTHAHGTVYPREQDSTLSWAENLREEVTGVKNPVRSNRSPWGIIPEIARNGNRRCVFIDQNGRRCVNYTAKNVLCNNHSWARKYLKGYVMSHDSVYTNVFKSNSLKEMYQAMESADARDLRSEIALQRTMLAALVSRMPEEITPETLPIELIDTIVSLTSRLSTTIKKYDEMQQKLGLLITPDQLNKIMMRMLETVRDVLSVSHDDFILLANKFSALEFTTASAAMIPLTNKVTLDHNYGVDNDKENHNVTKSTCSTRYLKGGGVVEVTAEVEYTSHHEKQAHMVERYNAEYRNKEMPREDEYHPRTEINGLEVPLLSSDKEVNDLNSIHIGDANDPFHLED